MNTIQLAKPIATGHGEVAALHTSCPTVKGDYLIYGPSENSQDHDLNLRVLRRSTQTCVFSINIKEQLVPDSEVKLSWSIDLEQNKLTITTTTNYCDQFCYMGSYESSQSYSLL